MATVAELTAAEFTGTLFAAIDAAGGPRQAVTAGYRHFSGAFDAEWLAALDLPIGEGRPPSLPVALLEDQDEFDRHTNDKALADAYADHPRTRVYEDIGRDSPDAWYALTARHLGRLARCELQVVCSIFESRSGDESLGAHEDRWYGAIVQMGGSKKWNIGESLLEGTAIPAQELTTKAGDILLLPKGLPHVADTPGDPGHSTHLAFAIDRDP